MEFEKELECLEGNVKIECIHDISNLRIKFELKRFTINTLVIHTSFLFLLG